METTFFKPQEKEVETKSTYYKLINNLLLKVQKPAQYLGIEWGHLIKPETADIGLQSSNFGPPASDFRLQTSDFGLQKSEIRSQKSESRNPKNLKSWSNAQVKVALIYPDLYELGMANFGTKILYQIINSHPDYLCDRAYAPMKDMEELLRKENVSLWSWESFKPLNNFELLGFSLSYELSYTNVLNILELSHIELLSTSRKNIFPLIFAGGPSTFNPEPMADFIDFFIIGDGEEVIIEVLDLIKQFKAENFSCHSEQSEESNNGIGSLVANTPKDYNISKDELLLKLAQIPGIYVPKFYTPDPNQNYLPKPNTNISVPEKIIKRVVNLSNYNQPISSPIPYLASVQDRQVLEIRRGCDRGCRFCQPGYVYLPVRERTPQNLVELSISALKNTGYDEYSLLSLSASDYTSLHELAVKLNNTHSNKGISLSMPSQRADRFDLEIANELNTVRKSGITLAPEAGTERLREVINKGLKEEDIKKAIENVYDSGFNHVKLYFMIGLPTETFTDLDGIIDLLRWACNLSKIKNKKPLDTTCTISTFVPKAFTPFQWFSQNSISEFEEKINYLKQKIKEYKLRTVKLNCTEPKIALLEAVLSRGDRRISKVIYNAYKKGAKFDAWDECLNLTTWLEAGKELGTDLIHEAIKPREIASINPWDVIDTGLLNKFLIEEWNKAVSVKETSPCTENTCHACGVCFELGVLNVVSTDRSKNNKFVKEIPHHCQEGQGTDEAIRHEVSSRTFSEGSPFNPLVDPSLCSGQYFALDCFGAKAPRNDVNRGSLPTKSVQKIEIVHTKTSNLRFISHLDVQRLFERAMRRADIPISFTEGFNPRPKMQWLMPLPLYYESYYEVMHLELSDYVKDSELQVLMNSQLPPEFQLKRAKTVNLSQKMPDINNIKVLYKILTCKPYIWEKYICELRSQIESFLTQNSLILKVLKNSQDKKIKSERQLDIRPKVEGIRILNTTPLELELKLVGNTRAEIILDYLTPKELKEESFQNDWQINWKIIKEMIVV